MKNYQLIKFYLTVFSLFWINLASASTCDTICQNIGTKKYFVSGVTDVTGYTWTTTGGIAILSGQTTDTINVSFAGVTSTGTYTISVRSYNLCDTTAPTTFSVFVQTTPIKPSAGNDTAICSGLPLALNASGSSGASFSWKKPDGTFFNGAIYNIASASAVDSGLYILTQSLNGCPSLINDSVFVTVNTRPSVALNTTTSAPICETSTKSLTGTPVGGSWTIVSGGGSIFGNTFTPNNVTANTNVTVRYTVAANGVCPSTTSDSTFMVNFIDTAKNTTSTLAICETGTKTLTATPAAGTWSIVSGGGSIAGTTYTPDNITANTNVTVRYTVAANGACPSTTSDSTFTVNFIDTAKNTTSTLAICETGSKTLSATPATGTWSILSGGGSIAGTTYTPDNITANTNVTVRYTVAANGACPSTTSDSTFTVNFIDTAKNTTSTLAICETGTKTLSGTPATGTWSIVSGGGSIAGTTYTPDNITANTSVTVRYTVAANGACPSTTSDSTFMVNFIDTAKNTTSTLAICETGTKTLSGTPATGTWSIVSGGGSIAGTTYTPDNITANTSVTVRYTVAANGACPSTTSDSTFMVNFIDTAKNTTSTLAICETGTKTLSGTPAGGTWSIISGGGSITGTTYTPANVSASTSVTVRYSLAANGSCPASFSDSTFTVNHTPNAPIANRDTIICSNSSLNLVATGEVGATFSWTRPDGSTFTGSTISIPSIALADSGRYVVNQTTVFGCTSTSNDTVNVNVITPPVIALDTVIRPSVCTGSNGSITISGLKPSTTYSVSYLNPSNVAINLTLTSNASGKIVIVGLPVGTYKDITVTTVTGGCPSNKLASVVIKGPAPTGTPVINCK